MLSLPAGVTAKAGGVGILLVDSSGQAVGTVGGGYAHDSIVNGSGEGVSTPVTTQLVKQSGQSLTVQVGVDPQWLGDSARVFPVAIDPIFTANTYQTPGSYDAYVDSLYNTTPEGAFDPTVLKVGTFNGGGEVDRTYLYFNGVPQNVQVTEAHMTLYNSYSYSCVPFYRLGQVVGSNHVGWLSTVATGRPATLVEHPPVLRTPALRW